MSKTISVALKAHYALGSTTIARCWRFERQDGQVVTVTTCARDLLISGEIYRSKDGVNPTALEQQSDAAVPNSEINGTLSTEFATEAEILKGLWDSAFVTIFEVNYRDLSMGQVILQTGTLGDVKVGRQAFNAEVRGIAQALQQTVGDLYQATCRAQLGDEFCKYPIETLRVAGSITSVDSVSGRRKFTDSSRAEVSDWFGAGVITWDTGANAGASMEINAFASGVFELCLPMAANVAVGDTYTVIPGCRKRHERNRKNPLGVSDCKDKYSNVVNFRGEPMVPGADIVLGLGGTEGSNL